MDTGWASPVRLNNNINRGLVQSPSLSPDGKKLYFVAWTTGGWAWDIWVSNWSDSLSDWGESVRVDTTINTPYNEWTVHIAPDGKHLYFASDEPRQDWFGNMDLYVSALNDSTATWGPKQNLGGKINYPDICGPAFLSDDGASLTSNGSKLYFSKYIGSPHNFELFVAYKDTSGTWQRARRLNINAVADTGTIDPSRDVTGWDLYPTVSPDGKTLFFSSRRQAYLYGKDDAIWMSRLLVDENGDTVITSVHEEKPFEPIEYHVYQNYPNPFNPETIITYDLPKSYYVRLIIYDVLGREVRRLVDTHQEFGHYTVVWDSTTDKGTKAAAGTYFYRLQVDALSHVRKMILIR